jgi:hypothetical protein
MPSLPSLAIQSQPKVYPRFVRTSFSSTDLVQYQPLDVITQEIAMHASIGTFVDCWSHSSQLPNDNLFLSQGSTSIASTEDIHGVASCLATPDDPSIIIQRKNTCDQRAVEWFLRLRKQKMLYKK